MNKFQLLLFSLLFISTNLKASDSFNLNTLSQIPILSNGRIKPLDTYARINLSRFHNKDSLNKTSAIEWFTELIFDPTAANEKKIFRIINLEVLGALGIAQNPGNNYSAMELINTLQKNSQLIEGISNTAPEEQTPAQKQIIDLYSNIQLYIEISRSFSMVFKEFEIHDVALAKKLNLKDQQKLSYQDILKEEIALKKVLNEFIKQGRLKNPNQADQPLLEILNFIDFIRQDDQSSELKIFPPASFSNNEQIVSLEWFSPWKMHLNNTADNSSAESFKVWQALYEAYHTKDFNQFNALSEKLLQVSQLNSQHLASATILKLETHFNRLNIFVNSTVFYILSFLLFALSSLFYQKILSRLSFISLSIGAVIHLCGIVIRCLIMNRAPVSSLYESIIFVSLIAVVVSLFIEFKHKNGTGTFIGSTLGALLLLVSFGYEKDGDSMGMLVAVLDTNFWLATHVVTISIGYGCSLVASLLAHLYLFKKRFRQLSNHFAKSDEQKLLKNIHSTVLFSLFFTVLGTILGGIWADQSWGRFWGWDPKENGALFLCLWLLFILHGKLAGYFKKTSLAVATGLTSVIVILAWFGVNLLNVGLHSYGFTESIAQNIVVFSAVEFATLFYFLFTKKKSLN